MINKPDKPSHNQRSASIEENTQYKIILNTSFITLNEYIDLERSNRYKAAKCKKSHTDKVHYLALQDFNKCQINTKKDVVFIWFTPDNRKDDSPKYIGNIAHIFEVDKSRSYISCIVEFVDKIEIVKHNN